MALKKTVLLSMCHMHDKTREDFMRSDNVVVEFPGRAARLKVGAEIHRSKGHQLLLQKCQSYV